MVQNSMRSQYVSVIHSPTSSGVSEQESKRMSAMEHTSEASSVEQAKKWGVRVNEQMDEQVTQYLRLDTLVHRQKPW